MSINIDNLITAIRENRYKEQILSLSFAEVKISFEQNMSLIHALQFNTTITHVYIKGYKGNCWSPPCLINNDQGIQGLLKTNKTITHLSLTNHAFTMDGIANGLRENSTLTHLDLRGNGLNIHDCTFLFDAVTENKSLMLLDLRENPINFMNEGASLKISLLNPKITEFGLYFQKEQIDAIRHYERTELLSLEFINLCIQCNTLRTIFESAVRGGHKVVVKQLLSIKEWQGYISTKGFCIKAMMSAVRKNYISIIDELLKINGIERTLNRDSHYESLLDVAASTGNLGLVQRLLETPRLGSYNYLTEWAPSFSGNHLDTRWSNALESAISHQHSNVSYQLIRFYKTIGIEIPKYFRIENLNAEEFQNNYAEKIKKVKEDISTQFCHNAHLGSLVLEYLNDEIPSNNALIFSCNRPSLKVAEGTVAKLRLEIA